MISFCVSASFALLVAPPQVRRCNPARMSSDDLYLGVDCGTQGTKVVIYDAGDKEIVGVGSVAYDLNPSSTVGEAEQDPQIWVDAMYDAAGTALAAATKARGGKAAGDAVRGIGVSGQQHGLVALDADYGVIRPSKLWCDTESAPEAEALSKKLG